MKIVLFISHISQNFTCVTPGYKDLIKQLLMKLNIKKILWIHLQTTEIS